MYLNVIGNLQNIVDCASVAVKILGNLSEARRNQLITKSSNRGALPLKKSDLVSEVDDLGGDGVDLLVERLVRERRRPVPLDQTRHPLPVRLLLVAARLQ